MSTGAISLHTPRGARMARVVVAFECFLDRKGIISVVAGRVLSRQVVGHISKSNSPRRLAGQLSTTRCGACPWEPRSFEFGAVDGCFDPRPRERSDMRRIAASSRIIEFRSTL